jgi:hypothetical protein
MKLQGFIKPIQIPQAASQSTPANGALRIKSKGTAVGQVGSRRQIGKPERIALIGQQTMVAGMTPSQLGVDRCGRKPITSRLMLLRLLKSVVAAVIEVSALHVISPTGSSISDARMTTTQGQTRTR